VPEFIESFAKARKELSKQINELMWHLRGSLSREEAWTLSIEERREHVEAIEKRIEVVEKTGLPLL
jgi:uncharacterized protein YbcI